MARSGSFGTSVNPFGTGTFGGLAQYNIGDNLKDLTAYRLEIAWGNGDITDAEYAASLAGLAAAADPNTQAQISAYNKLEDVQYRIARSEADAAGLDSLIAFEQQALSGMNPGNLRYRDVKSSLDALLANRRSRDYGVIMDAYNAGQTSTESLLAWVENTRASLPADAPDRDNWDSVHANLVERVVSEKDAQVYQDYQDKKLSGADFVAYLTGRRDAYAMDSPKWDEADRRLKDAEKNVKDTAAAASDQDVFSRYAEGKISDATYLKYIKARIDGMDPTDPQLPEWKSKLTQAAHSLAEDDLRHKVATATSAAGDAKARKNLRDFYIAYSKTLNPGSAEYRQTEEQILALKPAAVATGGGGTGKGTAKGTGVGVVEVHKGVPKIIPTVGGLGFLVTLVTPSARESKKAQAISVANLRLNLQEAQSALAEGDKVWLFHDPRYPGQMVTRRNPDGTVWKDPKTGKTELTPGSSYRATSSDTVAGLQMATANYSFDLAGVAAAKGDVKGYDTALWHAKVALERVRTTQAHAVQVDITNHVKALDAGIEAATKFNDPALVVNLLSEKHELLEQAALDARLDSAAQESWAKKLAAVEDDPRYPKVQEDLQGKEILGSDGRRTQIGGSVDIAASPKYPDGSLVLGQGVRSPGWHFVLKTDSDGKAAWGDEWEDPQLGTWAFNPDGSVNRVAVQTGVMGRRVTGWVKVEEAGSLGLWITTTDGAKKLIPYVRSAKYISYRDGYGNLVTGYSIDNGKTWVQATGGTLPQLELSGKMNYEVSADGSITVTDNEKNVIFTTGPEGSNPTMGDGFEKAGAAGAVLWYGQANLQTYGVSRDGVGAQGQQFRIVKGVPGSDGSLALNLVPREIIYAEVTAGNVAARVTKVQKAGAAPGASLAEESAAIKARGLQGTPTTPLTGSDYVRSKREQAERVAAVEARAGDTRAEETNAIEARSSQSYISSTTGFNLRPNPAVEGIIALGNAIVAAVSPPTWLPPVYVPPSSLTPPQQYVPPSSLTAIPVPTLKPVTPYVPPSSLTQTPKVTPKSPVTPAQIAKMTPSPTSPGGTIPKATPKVPVAPAPPKYRAVPT